MSREFSIYKIGDESGKNSHCETPENVAGEVHSEVDSRIGHEQRPEDAYHCECAVAKHQREESGEGYSDIIIEVPESRTGVVVELKYAESGGGMEVACVKALGQIDTKDYTAYLEADGMKNIVKIGIA